MRQKIYSLINFNFNKIVHQNATLTNKLQVTDRLLNLSLIVKEMIMGILRTLSYVF
jgi:hypothetical protein